MIAKIISIALICLFAFMMYMLLSKDEDYNKAMTKISASKARFADLRKFLDKSTTMIASNSSLKSTISPELTENTTEIENSTISEVFGTEQESSETEGFKSQDSTVFEDFNSTEESPITEINESKASNVSKEETETEEAKTSDISEEVTETEESKTSDISEEVTETEESKTSKIPEEKTKRQESKTSNIPEKVTEAEEPRTSNIPEKVTEAEEPRTSNIPEKVTEAEEPKTSNVAEEKTKREESKTSNVAEEKTERTRSQKTKTQESETSKISEESNQFEEFASKTMNASENFSEQPEEKPTVGFENSEETESKIYSNETKEDDTEEQDTEDELPKLGNSNYTKVEDDFYYNIEDDSDLNTRKKVFNLKRKDYSNTQKRKAHSDTEILQTEYGGYVFDNAVYAIETFVFVDKNLTHLRNIEDTYEEYVKIIFKQVNSYFTRDHLRQPIRIALTGVEIIDMGLIEDFYNNGTEYPYILTKNFCKFQNAYFLSYDKNPPDMSLLLTAVEICPSDGCNLLSATTIGSMCTGGLNRCMVIMDNGYSTAAVIAHEFGYALGMPHDSKEVCGDYYMPNTTMSTFMEYTKHSYFQENRYWSECSAKGLDEYIKIVGGNCLKNNPIVDLLGITITNLIGAKISQDEFCKKTNDDNFLSCPTSYKPCSKIYCKNGTMPCARQYSSLLEGMKCNKDSYCYRGVCYKEPPIAINGGWGPWSLFGNCTRPCGGGVQLSTRKCDLPKPEYDGRYCDGPAKQYKSCNVQPCQKDDLEFRTEQCQKQGFQQAVHDEKAPCFLICSNSSMVRKNLGLVIDGTRCFPKSYGICINGICRKAGCDNVINSDTKNCNQ